MSAKFSTLFMFSLERAVESNSVLQNTRFAIIITLVYIRTSKLHLRYQGASMFGPGYTNGNSPRGRVLRRAAGANNTRQQRR